MDWSEGGKTPYDILGLENGPEATFDEIKKVFRKLAVVKHPDKNRNNPNAAEEFAEIDKAYRVLIDENARGALNEYLAAKAARVKRDSHASDKRRKMKEELEARERRVHTERSEEEIARARLKVELDRLRKKAEEEERSHRQAAAQVAAAVQEATGGGSGAESQETLAQLVRTLKVTWDPEGKEYLPDHLLAIFSEFGRVEDVILRERKKKKKHKATALVLMGDVAAAVKAAGSLCGDLANPLLVMQLRTGAEAVGAAGAKYASDLHAEIPPPGEKLPAALSSGSRPNSMFGGASALFKGSQPPKSPLFPTSFPSSVPSSGGGGSLFPVAEPSSSAQPQDGSAGGSSGDKTRTSSLPSGAFSSFKASSFPSNKAPAAGGAFEGAILEKMRREAERQRALAAAKEEADS